MAEDACVEVGVQVVLVVLLNIGVARLLARDKRAVCDVRNALQLRLQGAGLLLGEVLVDKGEHRVLPLQILQVLVGVVGHEGKRPHNQQAGHRDADGRKGHKAVGEHVLDALPEEIFKIVSHSATS